MKKKCQEDTPWDVFHGVTKILLKMRLTLFVIMISFFGAMASESYSQTTKLTLDLKNVKVRDTLNVIENRSDFFFLYSEKFIDVNREVNIKVQGSAIGKILDMIFAGTDVNYTVKGRQIVLKTPESNNIAGTFFVGQQQKTVTGKVTDSSGGSLPGVSVVVKGTIMGTITDFDGNYSLTNIPENTTLQFSFVGMKRQEVTIGTKTKINIVLAEDAIGLDEVVAIGYGTQKKRDVSGAVETVKSEDLETGTASNFAQALQGKASGVQVIQTTGQPGANVSLQLRSNPSFANAGVLYVLDGVPINDNAGTPNSAKYGTTGVDQSPLNFINPNDIESITFLKDASSASIYGARAGAGVILITTKKGKTGKPIIKYNMSYASQHVDKMYDVLNTTDYMIQKNLIGQEVWMRNNKVAPYYGTVEESSLDSYIPFYSSSEISSATLQQNAIDGIVRSGYTQQHNLSVLGGTDKTTYSFSGNYYDQKGILIGSNYKRYNGKLSLDQIISAKLKIGATFLVSNSTTDNIVTGGGNENGGILTSAIYYPATLPLQDSDGDYPLNSLYTNIPNPLSFETITDFTNSHRTLTHGYAEWNVIKDLVAKGTFSYDQTVNKRNSFYPTTFSYGAQTNGMASINEKSSNTKLIEFTLNYKRDIGKKSKLSGLLGYSYQLSNWEGFGASNQDFISNSLSYYNLGSGQAISPAVSSSKSEETWASYFGRAIYQYDNKYIIQASLRRDGSSKFAENEKWGLFKAISASWVASDENFIKNIPIITNLKLRLGYGETGNSSFPGSAFEIYGIGASPVFGENSVSTGIFLSQAANSDLTWETAAEKNIGFDFGIFKNRIAGSIDVYSKTIKNLISWIPFPSDFVVSGVYGNAGKTKSTGYDIAIQSKNLISKNEDGFSWTTSFTFSHYLNYWIERSSESLETLPKYEVQTGKKAVFNGYYGYESDGLFKGEYGTAPTQMPNMLPGGIIIKDINGYDDSGNLTGSDGIITAADQTLVANMDPKFNFGIGNSFTFKNFDLSIYFAGMVKKEFHPDYPTGIYRMNLVEDNLYTYGWNCSNTIKNRWTFQNPNATRPTGVDDGTYANYQNYSDYWVVDASFIRCKNITLGYTIPRAWLRQNIISSCKLYVDIQNAFTITKYPQLDPEQDQSNYYPYSKSVVFGLNVEF